MGWFHLLIIADSAVMNIHERVFEYLFSVLGSMYLSRIAWAFVNSVLNFLKNYQTLFHSVCTFRLPRAMHKGSNLSTSSLTLASFCYFSVLLCVFLYKDIPAGVKRYLILVLIWASLIPNNVDHFSSWAFWSFV